MAFDTVPLFIPGAPGGPELLIILFIAILLFGANKIPKLARSTGEAMGEFQKGREKVETELEEMRESGFEEETTSNDAKKNDEFVDTEPVTNEETNTETETESK